MVEVTRRELAEKIGCTKQTVANALKEIDLEGHVTVRGQTAYYDEHAASAVADMLAPRFSAKDSGKDAGGADGQDSLLSLVEHYRRALEDSERARRDEAERRQAEADLQRSYVESIQTQLSRAWADLDDERAEREALSRELDEARAALREVAAAPFWRRGDLARRALPPAPGCRRE